MPDQQSNTVKQPEQPPQQPQVELEKWARCTGAGRFLQGSWERGASGTLTQRIASIYLKKVLELYEKSRHSPGRQAHVWALMHSPAAVKHVALESLTWLLGNMKDATSYNKVASIIGRRAEYVLWLTHPAMRGRHLEGLQLAGNNDLGMDLMRKRLRDKGFRKAAAFKGLSHVERAALGAFFIECIALSTKMVEVKNTTRNMRRYRTVNFTTLYWNFLRQWRDTGVMFRPLYVPMIEPPRPWTDYETGGYRTIRTGISTVDWSRWPEVSKRMLPCVMDSLNYLQQQPFRLDQEQLALLHTCWERGHEVGSLPAKERLEEPVDSWFKQQGLGPSAYWRAVWKWKADQRKDAARSSVVNAFITEKRLSQEASADLYWVWHMDHRGRAYCRGAQLNPQGPDHFRSLFQFQERSPMKGNERAFAWSLGDALGLIADPNERLQYLRTMAPVLARVGGSPWDATGYWLNTKKPWRLLQLCRDWYNYAEDPGYCTGTVHWLDQTCSGWGHVACLTGDANLARYTNVTGNQPADLYLGIGRVVMARIANLMEDEEQEPERLRYLEWWRNHQIPRSLWKSCLMPVIYGRSYLSLSGEIKMYLREEIEDFLTDQGLRVVDLALTLATVVNDVVKELLPNVRDLARWLTQLSNLQIDAGLRPYWFTPNGLAVECYSSETRADEIKLNLARRTIQISLSTNDKCKIDRRRTARKLVPDYIHSFDAAFLQRFVAHWATYRHPLSAVHDCFGTTIGNVETMQRELQDQWHRFYSVDHLTRHQGMVAALVGEETPNPPMVGTLDRNQLGENPFLFS